MIRILGIDPGTLVVGFGCLELAVDDASAAGLAPLALRVANLVRAGASGRLRTIDCGVLELGGRRHSVPERLCRLGDLFRELMQRLQPDELALEEAFYGKSAQAALRIGEARGVLLAEAARANLAIHQYPPARIKRSVSGRGNADKAAVADMVLRQLGATATAALPPDASDALAAAFTRVEERRSPMRRDLAIAAAAGGEGSAGRVPRRRRRSR